MTRDDLVAFVDLETTGLEPATDCLLEVGVVLTDGQFEPLRTFHALVKPLPFSVSNMNNVARTMHEKNGLLAECQQYGMQYHVVAAELSEWLHDETRDFGQKLDTIPLGGSSVHFDRGFLKQWMPAVEQLFHYRNIDVSSIKELIRRRYGADQVHLPPAAKGHRSISDLQDTLSELNYYLNNFFIPF